MPRPAAMPRSASRASPGPLTTQPITATCSGMLRSSSAAMRVVRDLDHVDLGAPAARARDEVEALALAQAERLEQRATGARLLDRIGGERVADRVADALGEQRADPGGRLHEPGGRRPGLGDAEVQRVVDRLGEQAVRVDHRGDVARLHRDLAVVEADLARSTRARAARTRRAPRASRHRTARRCRVEAAGVHADADRQAAVLRLARDELDVLGLADVAGVEPQPLDAGLHRGEREPVLEVDVGDDRHRRAGHDLREPLGRGLLVARAAHDVAARRRRARRSGRACRRRRRSSWWSSTGPRSARRRRRRRSGPTPTTWRVCDARTSAALVSRSVTRPGRPRVPFGDRLADVQVHRRQPERAPRTSTARVTGMSLR